MLLSFVRACLSFPALPLLLVLAGLACLRWRRPWWGRSLLALGVGSLWLLSTALGAGWMAAGLERYPALVNADHLRANGWQAIVVIGGGRQVAAPEYDGRDVPGYWTASRLRLAAELYRQSSLPLAVSGGLGPYDTEPEAMLMAHSLVHDHVVNVRWQEAVSRTTDENARELRRGLAPQGIDRIVLVTQALHMPRARLAFEKAGFVVLPAPVDFVRGSASRTPLLLNLLPHPRYLTVSAQAWHEYAGLLAYRLRYAFD
ncbi:MAG: YdcF family protein [Moraxellaceae bacterium]|nr:YdcF family protein [Moraxellaceae bacterium]